MECIHYGCFQMSEYIEKEIDTNITLLELDKHAKLMEINKHHLTTLMESSKSTTLMEIKNHPSKRTEIKNHPSKRTILLPGDYVYMRDNIGYNREWTQKGVIIELKEAQYAIRVLGSFKIVLKNRENLRKSMFLGNQ